MGVSQILSFAAPDTNIPPIKSGATLQSYDSLGSSLAIDGKDLTNATVCKVF